MQKEIFKGLLALFCCASLDIQAQEPAVEYGTIDYFDSFESEYVQDRAMAVWLPPDYSMEKEYPVIVMYDGQMLFDASTTWNKQSWDVDDVLGYAIETQVIEPASAFMFFEQQYGELKEDFGMGSKGKRFWECNQKPGTLCTPSPGVP